MSQPGQVKLKIAKKQGKAIPPGSSFAKVDWDRADGYLSGSHNPDDFALGTATQIFHEAAIEAEKEGRDNRAKRLKSEIVAFDNARFAIRASWCPSCINFLHNCQCEVEAAPVSTEFIDSLTSRLGQTHSMKRKAKRLAKLGG